MPGPCVYSPYRERRSWRYGRMCRKRPHVREWIVVSSLYRTSGTERGFLCLFGHMHGHGHLYMQACTVHICVRYRTSLGTERGFVSLPHVSGNRAWVPISTARLWEQSVGSHLLSVHAHTNHTSVHTYRSPLCELLLPPNPRSLAVTKETTTRPVCKIYRYGTFGN